MSIIQARTAIRRAALNDAQKKHPYELALAREYYVKAKEEAGYSQFELSEKLAKQSISYAKLAAGEAAPTPTPEEEAPGPEMPLPLETPPEEEEIPNP